MPYFSEQVIFIHDHLFLNPSQKFTTFIQVLKFSPNSSLDGQKTLSTSGFPANYIYLFSLGQLSSFYKKVHFFCFAAGSLFKYTSALS